MLSNKISIVIPCKNEGVNIYDCIGLITKQKHIEGVNVIIADVSNEKESLKWLTQARIDFQHKVNIKVIKGGFPAKGRLEGSRLVKTPYILFLDADIMLVNDKIINNSCELIMGENYHLLTVPFQTESGWNWAFRIFDTIQWLSWMIGTPFAIGGFQLFKTEAYWAVGGYIEDELFAEDYSISSKIKANKFIINKMGGIWTSARRFKNKGVWWMVKIMFKSYINRNNPQFFKHHHNYWN